MLESNVPLLPYSENHKGHTNNKPSSSGCVSSLNPQLLSPENDLLEEFLSLQQLGNTDLDLIDVLTSEPQKQVDPLKTSPDHGNPSTYDSIIEELLMENLLNNEDTYPDLAIYNQSLLKLP